MKFAIFKNYLLVLTVNAVVTAALNADTLPGLGALSDTLVRESAIAFVNTTISPGLEGATLTVDDGNRQSASRLDPVDPLECVRKTRRENSADEYSALRDTNIYNVARM